MKQFFLGMALMGISYTLFSQSNYNAYQAPADPVIDGLGTEACWQGADWKNINQLWIGSAPSSSDFQGKYKVVWRGSKLFILAEIVDDVLYDGHANPLVEWYNDDCVEIFIDEDNSNGNHQCNYSAFAYHVAINGDAVDLGTDCNPHLYNSHISSAHTQSGTTYTWEIAMTIYSSSYSDASSNTPVSLYQGKVCGFSLAYCDDDGSNVRESFMGSEVMPAGHNNDNYITADYFGNVTLLGPNPLLGIDMEEDHNDQSMLNKIIITSNNQQIKIQNEATESNSKISILNAAGFCEAKIELNQHSTYLSNALPGGCYIILVETGTQFFSEKIIVY